ELASKIKMPRFIDSFEENGNFYLVVEYIRGRTLDKEILSYRGHVKSKSLNQLKVEKRITYYLLQVATILEKLHQAAIVHRDATGNNFMITPTGKVYLIDMELSYALRDAPNPPFVLGTDGY